MYDAGALLIEGTLTLSAELDKFFIERIHILLQLPLLLLHVLQVLTQGLDLSLVLEKGEQQGC